MPTSSKKYCSLQRRFQSLIVVVVFFVTNCFHASIFALPEMNAETVPGTHSVPGTVLGTVPISPISVSTLKVPAEIGKIEEVFQARGQETRDKGQESFRVSRPVPPAPFVILIQDAHAIPDAQRNIQKLIEHFQKKYAVPLVALEGASSELDPQIFKSFPDKEILQKTLNDYFERGELTGATAASIVSEGRAVYQGIEDWNLYEEGLGFYLKAMEKEPELMEKLHAAGNRLQEEKEKIYSKELLEVDKTLEAFKKNDTDLVTVLKRLKIRGQSPNEGQVGDRQYEVVPVSIRALLEEIEKEGKDQSAIEREVREIAEEVKKYFEQESPQTTDDRPQEINIPWTVDRGLWTEFNAKYQEFQTSQITPEAFALFLKELLELHRHEAWVMSLEKVYARLTTQDSRLVLLMKNHKHLRDIQSTQFFSDFEIYVKSVKESLFRNEEDRRLDAESRQLDLLEKLAKLELSREEWNEIKAVSDKRKVIRATHGSGILNANHVLLTAHLAFYENAELRDAAFVENLMRLMQKKNLKLNAYPLSLNASILIAGGFHTEGLARQFKEKGISYVVVRPEIGTVPEASLYRQHMRGEVSWKHYFEAKGGKVNLYKAFVRGTRDRLLRGQETRARGKEPFFPVSPVSRPLLKAWRDQILRDLAQKEQLTKAHEYTQFLDEISQDSRHKTQAAGLSTNYDVQKKWLTRIDRFIQGLRYLNANKKLTEQNIVGLLGRANIPDSTGAVLALRSEMRADLLGLDTANIRRAEIRPASRVAGTRNYLRTGRSEVRAANWSESKIVSIIQTAARIPSVSLRPEDIESEKQLATNIGRLLQQVYLASNKQNLRWPDLLTKAGLSPDEVLSKKKILPVKRAIPDLESPKAEVKPKPASQKPRKPSERRRVKSEVIEVIKEAKTAGLLLNPGRIQSKDQRSSELGDELFSYYRSVVLGRVNDLSDWATALREAGEDPEKILKGSGKVASKRFWTKELGTQIIREALEHNKINPQATISLSPGKITKSKEQLATELGKRVYGYYHAITEKRIEDIENWKQALTEAGENWEDHFEGRSSRSELRAGRPLTPEQKVDLVMELDNGLEDVLSGHKEAILSTEKSRKVIRIKSNGTISLFEVTDDAGTKKERRLEIADADYPLVSELMKRADIGIDAIELEYGEKATNTRYDEQAVDMRELLIDFFIREANGDRKHTALLLESERYQIMEYSESPRRRRFVLKRTDPKIDLSHVPEVQEALTYLRRYAVSDRTIEANPWVADIWERVNDYTQERDHASPTLLRLAQHLKTGTLSQKHRGEIQQAIVLLENPAYATADRYDRRKAERDIKDVIKFIREHLWLNPEKILFNVNPDLFKTFKNTRNHLAGQKVVGPLAEVERRMQQNIFNKHRIEDRKRLKTIFELLLGIDADSAKPFFHDVLDRAMLLYQNRDKPALLPFNMFPPTFRMILHKNGTLQIVRSSHPNKAFVEVVSEGLARLLAQPALNIHSLTVQFDGIVKLDSEFLDYFEGVLTDYLLLWATQDVIKLQSVPQNIRGVLSATYRFLETPDKYQPPDLAPSAHTLTLVRSEVRNDFENDQLVWIIKGVKGVLEDYAEQMRTQRSRLVKPLLIRQVIEQLVQFREDLERYEHNNFWSLQEIRDFRKRNFIILLKRIQLGQFVDEKPYVSPQAREALGQLLKMDLQSLLPPPPQELVRIDSILYDPKIEGLRITVNRQARIATNLPELKDILILAGITFRPFGRDPGTGRQLLEFRSAETDLMTREYEMDWKGIANGLNYLIAQRAEVRMEGWIYREPVEEDIQAMREFFTRSFRRSQPVQTFFERNWNRFRRILLDDTGRFAGAYDVLWKDQPARYRGEKLKMAVAKGFFGIDPKYSNQGYAAQFFTLIKLDWRRMGFDLLIGDSITENALGFWTKQGGKSESFELVDNDRMILQEPQYRNARGTDTYHRLIFDLREKDILLPETFVRAEVRSAGEDVKLEQLQKVHMAGSHLRDFVKHFPEPGFHQSEFARLMAAGTANLVAWRPRNEAHLQEKNLDLDYFKEGLLRFVQQMNASARMIDEFLAAPSGPFKPSRELKQEMDAFGEGGISGVAYELSRFRNGSPQEWQQLVTEHRGWLVEFRDAFIGAKKEFQTVLDEINSVQRAKGAEDSGQARSEVRMDTQDIRLKFRELMSAIGPSFPSAGKALVEARELIEKEKLEGARPKIEEALKAFLKHPSKDLFKKAIQSLESFRYLLLITELQGQEKGLGEKWAMEILKALAADQIDQARHLYTNHHSELTPAQREILKTEIYRARFKSRSEVRKNGRNAIEHLARLITNANVNQLAERNAQQIITYIEFRGVKQLRSELRKAVKATLKRREMRNRNTTSPILDKVWREESEALVRTLGSDSANKTLDKAGTVALVLSESLGESLAANFVKGIEKTNLESVALIGKGQAAADLANRLKPYDINVRPLSNLRRSLGKDEPAAIPTGIFDRRFHSQIDKTFLPFWIEQGSVGSPLVKDYVEGLQIVALFHTAQILQTKPELLKDRFGLRAELLKRLALFEGFDSIVSVDTWQGQSGFAISAVAAQAYLEHRSQLRIRQAA